MAGEEDARRGGGKVATDFFFLPMNAPWMRSQAGEGGGYLAFVPHLTPRTSLEQIIGNARKASGAQLTGQVNRMDETNRVGSAAFV